MKRYPKAVKIYICSIVGLAVLLLVLMSYNVQIDTATVQGFLFFSALAVATESLPVYLGRGGAVTVTVALVYGSIILFGPAVSMYIMIIANVGSQFFSREKIEWHKVFFNCAQYVIAIAIAGVVYKFTGGSFSSNNFFNIIPLLLAALTFFTINITAITFILALVQRVPPWGIWVTSIKWTIPNMLTLPVLGLIMAYVYVTIGPLGVFLFFAPLLLARFIFKSYMDTRELYVNTLEALASALDAKDRYTRGHSDRVAKYAVELARQLKTPEDQVEVIQHMALLHDIGKIGISDELLNRVGRLSDEEFDLIKLHPVIGANILRDLNYMGSYTEYVRYHHEKFDGSGYPDGLKGDDIPLGARIITLADSFDAMTTDRSYRKKMTVEEALDEVRRCAGSHFDPYLARAFLECWQEKAPVPQMAAYIEMASLTEK